MPIEHGAVLGACRALLTDRTIEATTAAVVALRLGIDLADVQQYDLVIEYLRDLDARGEIGFTPVLGWEGGVITRARQ